MSFYASQVASVRDRPDVKPDSNSSRAIEGLGIQGLRAKDGSEDGVNGLGMRGLGFRV